MLEIAPENSLSDSSLSNANGASRITLVNGSPGCKRCEALPSRLKGPGTIHMQFPLSHSRGKILNYVRENHCEYSQEGEVVSIVARDEDLAPLLAPLMKVLSSVEQGDVRVLFQQLGHEMQLADYFDVDTLHGFLTKTQSGWLLDMISQNRLTTWFQPIVECADPGRVFAYECLMRGSDLDGKTVFPDRILEVGRGAGLLFQLDRAARLTSIRNAAHFGLQSRIFINFTPTAIYDPINCLRSTVEAIDELGMQRDQIVFEVIESEFVSDLDHLKNILDYYRDGGFHVALDDVGAGYSNLNMLAKLRPNYIKLDRELTSEVHTDRYKAMIAQKLLETAQELGVTTIVEGVEREEEFEWLKAHGADYAQGYLFARPASPPPLINGQVAIAR